MSSSAVVLSQVRAGHVLDRLVVRLVRFWVVRRGGEVVGMDLLFVDEQSTLAHAAMNATLMPTFQPLLRDGSVYVLTSFDVGRVGCRYRLSDFHLGLRFNHSTSLTAVTMPVSRIPEQVFRFRSHEELKTIALFNTDLPDIIGQVCYVQTIHDGITNDLMKVLVTLLLDGGYEVRLTALDGQAVFLEALLRGRYPGVCVLLATNISPRMFGGKLHVGATPGTRFFFDDELDATRDFVKSVEPIDSFIRYKRVQRIKHASLRDMSYFVLTSAPQDIEFICTAKVIGIRGWSFIACSACGRKLHTEGSVPFCDVCGEQTDGGDVRYRVEMIVEDASSRAVFVVFDYEMEKLVSIAASKLVSHETVDGRSNGVDGSIPTIITGLIGSSFTFHLRLTCFNFSTYHESFTVYGIFRDAQEMAEPVFLEEDHPAASGSRLIDGVDEAGLGTSV